MNEHWDGPVNKSIRYYFYLTRGLETFDKFRYLLAAIFALYIMLHLNNPMFLVLMFVLCLPVIFIIGFYTVHKIGKVIEWLNLKFSTHYGIKQFELIERQTKALESIDGKIK